MLCINVPAITDNLSRATATVDIAKFNRDQLVNMANKTRAFVASETERNDLYGTIEQINKEANTQYANNEGADFAAVDEQYSLDSKNISHLQDVRDLFANVKIAFTICGVGAIIFLVLIFIFCGRSAFGRALMWSGLLILAILIILGVWAIIDFNSMFNWLHSLFFKGGTWLFSENSLMICMYPTAFWVGMASICVGTSLIASLILIIVGKIVK